MSFAERVQEQSLRGRFVNEPDESNERQMQKSIDTYCYITVNLNLRRRS